MGKDGIEFPGDIKFRIKTLFDLKTYKKESISNIFEVLYET